MELNTVNMSSRDKCACCSKSAAASTSPLKRCTRCNRVYYCSRDCQKTHWKLHKKICASLAQAGAADESVPDQAIFQPTSQAGLAIRAGAAPYIDYQGILDLSLLSISGNEDPFPMTARTLTDLPTKILARIIKACIPGGCAPDSLTIRADNPLGRWQHDWRPSWIPSLRLINRKIQLIFDQVVSNVAGLSACDWEDTQNSLQRIYRATHEHYENTPEWGHTLNLSLTNIFPTYLTNNVKHFRLCLVRSNLLYRFDNMDLSIFPRLRKFELAAGDPVKCMQLYAVWLSEPQHTPAKLKAMHAEAKVNAVKALLDEIGMPVNNLQRVPSLRTAYRWLTSNWLGGEMLNYAAAFRVACQQPMIARRAFRHYVTDVMGVNRDTIKGFSKDVLITVAFANELTGTMEAEKVIEIYITTQDYGLEVRSEKALKAYADCQTNVYRLAGGR